MQRSMKERNVPIGIDGGRTFAKTSVIEHDTWEIISEFEGIRTDEPVVVVGSGALCGR